MVLLLKHSYARASSVLRKYSAKREVLQHIDSLGLETPNFLLKAGIVKI